MCKKIKLQSIYYLHEAPKPGKNGINYDQLVGSKFVLTGTTQVMLSSSTYYDKKECTKSCKCLDFGKKELASMIKDFGGVVVDSMSDKVKDFAKNLH